MEIDRPWHLSRLSTLLRASPVVAILGPRQVGKTTLARAVARKHPGRSVVFDLENEAVAVVGERQGLGVSQQGAGTS